MIHECMELHLWQQSQRQPAVQLLPMMDTDMRMVLTVMHMARRLPLLPRAPPTRHSMVRWLMVVSLWRMR